MSWCSVYKNTDIHDALPSVMQACVTDFINNYQNIHHLLHYFKINESILGPYLIDISFSSLPACFLSEKVPKFSVHVYIRMHVYIYTLSIFMQVTVD